MNRSEIEKQLKDLNAKLKVMQEDLEKFAVELSATSQVAIIARIVNVESDIKDYTRMLEMLQFEDIVRGEFKDS